MNSENPLETLKRGKLINILMMGKMPQSVPFATPTQTKGCAFLQY